jgi:MFS family permease
MSMQGDAATAFPGGDVLIGGGPGDLAQPGPGQSDRAFEDATYRRVRWRLLPFLMVCYTFAYLDRINVGFAKLQMRGDLGLSETAYGFGAGVFFVGYILFGLPSNLLLHRVGARRWIAGTMIVWGILSTLTALVSSPAQFWLLRFLLGAAEAGFYPGVILYLTQWFPSGRRARMTAMFQSAIPIAGLFGGPLSGWILDRFQGSRGLHGWQWLFLIEATPAILIGFLALRRLDDAIAAARWLSPAQKALLVRRLDDGCPPPAASPTAAFRDWKAWRLGALLFCALTGLYAISFWLPTLLKEGGAATGAQIGWMSALPNLVALPAMYLLAASSDRSNERRWHVASAAFVAAAGLAGSAFCSTHLWLSLLCVSIASAGILSLLPLQWSLLKLGKGGAAAAAIGLVNALGNLGGAVGPMLMGWLKDVTHSLASGVYLTAGLLVIAGAIALATQPDRPIPTKRGPIDAD